VVTLVVDNGAVFDGRSSWLAKSVPLHGIPIKQTINAPVVDKRWVRTISLSYRAGRHLTQYAAAFSGATVVPGLV
jgi:hypothetical protein